MTVTDFAFYETHKAQHQGQTWKDKQSVRRVSSTDYIQKMAAIGEDVENDFLDKEHNVEGDDLPECVKGSLQISMKRCQKFWIMNPVKKYFVTHKKKWSYTNISNVEGVLACQTESSWPTRFGESLASVTKLQGVFRHSWKKLTKYHVFPTSCSGPRLLSWGVGH